jgi:hypothetical protein
MLGITYTNSGADTGSNNTGCKGINVNNRGGGGILRNGSGDFCYKNKGRGDGPRALERLAERGPQVHTGGKRR